MYSQARPTTERGLAKRGRRKKKKKKKEEKNKKKIEGKEKKNPRRTGVNGDFLYKVSVQSPTIPLICPLLHTRDKPEVMGGGGVVGEGSLLQGLQSVATRYTQETNRKSEGGRW